MTTKTKCKWCGTDLIIEDDGEYQTVSMRDDKNMTMRLERIFSPEEYLAGEYGTVHAECHDEMADKMGLSDW